MMDPTITAGIYGCESWMVSEKYRKKLMILRCGFGEEFQQIYMNDSASVLESISPPSSLEALAAKQKLLYFGYIMRMRMEWK